jgi:hypothetical protein
MIIRILATLIMLGFAVNAFWSNEFDMGYSVGVAFLLLAAVVWFAWNTMREGWSQGRSTKKGGDNVPIMQWDGVMDMRGMFNAFRPRRPRTSSAKSSDQQRL